MSGGRALRTGQVPNTILKGESGFADELDVGCEREKKKNDL